MRFRHDLKVIWHEEVVAKGQRPRFLVLASFLLTFLITRGVTYSIRYHLIGFLQNIQTANGVHVHHLVYGIVGLLIIGFVTVEFDVRPHRSKLAVLYGVAAALTLDEFALWLDLSDVYWSEQGRVSIDVVLIVATLIGVSWIISGFVVGMGRGIVRRSQGRD